MLVNTIQLGLGTSILAIILGVFLAFIIQKTDVYLKRFLGWFYLLPILIPPYVYALTWDRIFPKSELFHGIIGTTIVLTFSYFPFITLLTISGLNSMDRRLEEAARVSHNEFGILRKITMPLVLPYILAGGLLVFIFAISDYGVPSLMQLNVYTTEIFIRFSAFYDHGGAGVMAVPLALITFVLILLQKHYMKGRSYVTIIGEYKRGIAVPLEIWRCPVFLAVIAIISLIVLIPILTLIFQAGDLDSYKMAVKTSYREILLSLWLAIIGSALCVLISFFISYIIEKSHLRVRHTVDMLSVLPFAIPPTVLGIGLIRLWNRPMTGFIYGTSFILMLVYITISSPFVIRILCSNLKQIGSNLEEAAIVSRISWIKRTRKILLPLLKPGLKTGFIISFILCLRELGATLLVIPPGMETIPIKVYTLMHYGANKLVASLSLILLSLILIPILILNLRSLDDKIRKIRQRV